MKPNYYQTPLMCRVKKLMLLTLFFLIQSINYSKAGDTTYAITHVNVIPIIGEKLLYNQTVLIKNGKIASIKNAGSEKLPANVFIINGKNQYLMPGMADMHAHLPTGGSDEVPLKDYLKLNIVRGITMLRSMRGHESHPALRDSIRRRYIVGPDLYLASPVLPEEKDMTPDKAKALFREYKNKYDFVKYLYPLRPSLYDSVMMIAKQEGVKVAGHGPKGGIEAALKAKQTSIEHIDLFLREYKKDSLEFNKRIAQMAEAGIFSCPDVDWYYINWNQLKTEELKKRGGIQFLPPSLVDQWVSYSDKMHSQALEKNKEQFLNGIKTGKENLELFSKLLKKLNDARVPLLISAGDGYFIVPGYSFLNECKLFSAAGINNYDILKAATYNAAMISGETEEWGSVQENRRADLVLLSANPLDNIQNIEKINGVMLRGKWFVKKDLEKMRDGVKQ